MNNCNLNPQGLDVCAPSVTGYTQCPTDQYYFDGTILAAQTWDFSDQITQPYWALGVEFVGRQYELLGFQQPQNYFSGKSVPTSPAAINAQQALFYNTLRLYQCAAVNSTTAQMADSYSTPSGIVQTQFQILFDPTGKKITAQNLMSKLPGQTIFRPATEVLLSLLRVFTLQFSVPVASISIPFQI